MAVECYTIPAGPRSPLRRGHALWRSIAAALLLLVVGGCLWQRQAGRESSQKASGVYSNIPTIQDLDP